MDAFTANPAGIFQAFPRKRALVALGLFAVSMGCKTSGNPLASAVKVTQHPAQEEAGFPSPQTRLSSSFLNRNPRSSSSPTSPVAQASAEIETDQSPHTSTSAARSSTSAARQPSSDSEEAPSTAVSRRVPSTPVSKASAARSSTARKPANELTPLPTQTPAEYAELMDAFRNSPPEVQQQALRQLLAVTSRNAPKTESPRGIQSALKSAMKSLPELPEAEDAPAALPVRLAEGDVPEQSTAQGVVQAATLTDQTDLVAGVTQASGSSSPEPASATQPAIATEPIEELRTVGTATLESAREPSPSLGSASDEELYVELVKRLEQSAPGESEADRYRRYVIARSLKLFAGDPDGAVETTEDIKPAEQEFLRHYLLGLWTMIDNNGHPVASRRWSAAIPEIRLATQKLSEAAETLEVKSLAFCKEIQSFGQITPFETSKFTAGQKVILYCEIDNFVAKKLDDGFETHLQGSYELFDAKNQKVAGQVLPADKQLSANYLRDYFIAYQMSLPTNLEPGEYRLELTMECLQGQKYGQASIPLSVTK